jgi:cytochrome c peroxidase
MLHRRLIVLSLGSVGLFFFGLAVAPLLLSATPPPDCNSTNGRPNSRCLFTPARETGTPIGSLKTVVKPRDAQLAPGGPFVRDQDALVALGKAFFWDQQVGSDGQACGSCHFSAGADARTKNQVSPGLKAQPLADTTFQIGGAPNHTLVSQDFPIHKVTNPDVHGSRVTRDANDVVSSAGVFYREFDSIRPDSVGLAAPRLPFDANAMDNCRSVADPLNFQIGGVNVRRVEPRNTPTMINALFSNRNFWDSRAQDMFNGVNPFGARDSGAVVYEARRGPWASASAVSVRLAFSSLASQAVGPPTNEFEMSCLGRTFADVGHKLLVSTPTPLAQQDVEPTDSVLGPISNARFGRTTQGLLVTYPALIRQAFQPRWWQSLRPIDTHSPAGVRPQIEANFALFWGLAVQAYMETLRADDSPIDRFFDGTARLTDAQRRGLLMFESAFGTAPDPANPTQRVPVLLASGQPADTRCTACHGGPETTAARIDAVRDDARLERMAMPNGGCAIYDAGHFNTGVRRTTDDLGLGADDPFGKPLGETGLARIGFLDGLVAAATPPYGLVPALFGTTNCDAANVLGTFKAPQLRNVELTGPYFHNGGQVTLRQVIDFYNRGGDFNNRAEFDPNVHALGLRARDKDDLVAFLLALTDERVAFERAPFDHPSICVADGANGSFTRVDSGSALPGSGVGGIARAQDNVTCFGATGAAGRATRLEPFLDVNQFAANP